MLVKPKSIICDSGVKRAKTQERGPHRRQQNSSMVLVDLKCNGLTFMLIKLNSVWFEDQQELAKSQIDQKWCHIDKVIFLKMR